jgi:hypothetical protein
MKKMTTTHMSRGELKSYCSQADASLHLKGWKVREMSFGMPKGVR